jgi:hypothetical protein
MTLQSVAHLEAERGRWETWDVCEKCEPRERTLRRSGSRSRLSAAWRGRRRAGGRVRGRFVTLVHNLFAETESIRRIGEKLFSTTFRGGSGRLNEERKDRNSTRDAGSALLKPHGRSLEVTGLGVVTALALAFGTLVSDGTLPLSQYLVFVSFLAISAGAMVWRMVKLTPDGRSIEKRLQAGVYRISFHGR